MISLWLNGRKNGKVIAPSISEKLLRMLYTDGTHLVADTLDELFAYATKMCINIDWIHFSGKNVHPHFDICGQVRKRVLADKTVQLVSKKDIIRLCRLNYRPPHNEEETREWEQHHGKKITDVPMPSAQDYESMIAKIKAKTGL